MNNASFWLVIFSTGVAAFLLRYAFFFIFERYTVPTAIRSVLPFIPAAALSAIVAPLFFGGALTMPYAIQPRILAWLIAMLVAWRSKNIFFTIVSGLISLWILKQYLF
jgi:branched-subunit amino acid transport protein